ncbi:MAG: 6-bladed beta-propeller [Candidatus Thorarchaeota archaeon]
MRLAKSIYFVAILIPMLLLVSANIPAIAPSDSTSESDDGTRTVDLGNGDTIEVGPDEVLYKYVISQAPTSQTGSGDPLIVSEYGKRTDTFSDLSMQYDSGSQTTTTSNQSIPLGENWEGYQVDARVTDITENRTWLNNYGFSTQTTWDYDTNYTEGDWSGNNRVQFFSSGGTYEGQWGSRGTTSGQFIDPWGVAINSSGYVYVTDTGNHRVQVFDMNGNFVTQWGSRGTGHGEFNMPMGIAVATNGHVYVADMGNDRIQIFGPSGNYIGEWGSSGTGTGQFHQPVGVAIRNSNGYVYVTDMGNDRVQYFDANGNYQGTWGSQGTSTGYFNDPTGIAVNQNNGEVIVADSTYNRVQRFSATGSYLSLVGSGGSFSGSGSNGYFRNPIGVSVSSGGIIYVTDMGNDRIQYFSSTGSYQGQWGSDGTGNGNFRILYGIALNGSDHVYAVERGGTSRKSVTWNPNGHGTGDAAPIFQIGGYYHVNPSGLYGFWYNPGEKAFVNQTINVNRGDVTWMGVSLDYYADCRGWGSYMTGFFELFVSVGDPDFGGSYLWSSKFDYIADDNTWYSTGLVPVDYTSVSLPNLNIVAGLRVTQSEWYRSNDILPEGRLDNIVVYVKAKATPSQVNLKMNGVDVADIVQGSTALWGQGTASFTPTTPWSNGKAYANFSWSPSPFPPSPDLDIMVEIDTNVTVFARRYNVETVEDTSTFATGDAYTITNASDVQWTTNHYAAVPGGYESRYFFNVSLPTTRDVYHVGQPVARLTNLTSGWSYGDPGDELLNVSAYEITTTSLNGFWYLKGTSSNIITDLEVWDGSQWIRTTTFRANDVTQFRATLPTTYTNDVVNFTVYDSTGAVWTTLQATVDSSGHATTGSITLDPATAPVGSWEVQAYVTDKVSSGAVHNIGFFRRAFKIQHATGMFVKYPVDGVSTWEVNVTYGDIVLLQVRVNDSDNGDLLPGGTMTYTWPAGSGPMNDLGTGEYSIALNTSKLASNGPVDVSLSWSKTYYDSLARTFRLNVIFTSNLLSSDAPGVDVPQGYDAELALYYEDQLGNGVTGASITCNWTLGPYTVTPVGGSDGHYTLGLSTNSVPLGTYTVEITATKDYVESRTIILSVQVRELHTSAIPSTSHLSLPVGYITSFTITYTDTDHDTPITGYASAISLNWTGGHGYYTVVETTDPGVYNVTVHSYSDDTLGTYVLEVKVERSAAQNHTFNIDLELRTHLTSFYLTNPVDPTPYTTNIEIRVVYFDVDADAGIENGSTVGYYVLIYVVSSKPDLSYTVTNGSAAGEYLITIPASAWGSVGSKNLAIYANWTGPTVKYTNETIDLTVTVTATPTDIFIGENPVSTPYGENITFSLIYYDVAGDTGIVNATGIYAGNVHLTVTVLTSGQSLDQSKMVITEVDPSGSPGEYRFEFNSSLLSGLISCDIEIWFNWTKGQLPLYENKTLIITVYTTQRQAIVDWQPLPVTPYDELVNLTITYRDSFSGNVILNSSNLYISIQESITYTLYYDGDATGEFQLELNTSSWTPGTHTFHVNVTWVGSPYYQNRTSVAVTITVRTRYTELVHGAFTPIQYANNLTLLFTYRDLDDFSNAGINGSTLTLDSSLTGYYWVTDNGDGTYTLILDTTAFGSLGTFLINVAMTYGGSRYCNNASDLFYLTIVERRTQITSDLPSPAPYLDQANVTVTYLDDNTYLGINGATITASCATAATPLVYNTNYWVDVVGVGKYRVRISTEALGNFGAYMIDINATYSGVPYYQSRTISVQIEVSRRPATLSVVKSPLNTQFLDNVEFEITVTDSLSGTSVSLDKSVLILTHGSGLPITDAQYTLTQSGNNYLISINSTILTSVLVSGHPISILFYWGDVTPYYSNSTTSVEVTITSRATQVGVLSTPPSDIYYNATALIEFSDYSTSAGITGATFTVACLNTTPIQAWFIDNSDGTYEIRVNTSTFASTGRYYFSVNVSITGSPYYQNHTNIRYSIIVNPVATVLSVVVPSGATYYSGDIVQVNITFINIKSGLGIINADVKTNWGSQHGTSYTLTELGGGVYNLTIDTSGLVAGRYIFEVNASKYLHFNKTVTADIVLSPVPVVIELSNNPIYPLWGETIVFTANVTDARDGSPILGGTVTIQIHGDNYTMIDVGGGLYNVTVPSKTYDAGVYTVSLHFTKTNHEVRDMDVEFRLSKVPAILSLTLSSLSAVNGQSIAVEAVYALASNGSAISVGTLVFSWSGGNGTLTWNASQGKYLGTLTVTDVPVGNYQVLVQAVSTNYRSSSSQVSLEVREISTDIMPYHSISKISAVYGDMINITVYLNNTDLNAPVVDATVVYGVGPLIGNLSPAVEPGYYTALIDTGSLDVQNWVITVSSSKPAHTPSTTQFLLTVESIPTRVIVNDAQVEVYYGLNATFTFVFWDDYNNQGINGSTTSFELGGIHGVLEDLNNGTYVLTIDSTSVNAGPLGYDVFVSFQKPKHKSGFTLVKLVVRPRPTVLEGPYEVNFPVGDNYTILFTFRDSLTGQLITGATAAAIWEFGALSLTPLENGSYRFGPTETETNRLSIRSTPYIIRISLTKGNYSAATSQVSLTIRTIRTKLLVIPPPVTLYDGEEFVVRVTYWDEDHNVAIPGALNSTADTTADAVPELTRDFGNGTYEFGFVGHGIQTFDIKIVLSKSDYATAEYSLAVYTIMTPEQQSLYTGIGWLATGILLLSGLGALYIKVLSVPKMLRIIIAMWKKVRKGGVPEKPKVRTRREMLLDEMNADLASVRINKTMEDIAPSTVDISALDVETLLEELAVIVGLTEKDIDTLRTDLEKMRPSERAGFVQEVIRQERARRARDLAEAAEEVPSEELTRKLTEEELAHLREQLLSIGIEESEVNLLVEQARNLTKAEIDALLDQLGGGME